VALIPAAERIDAIRELGGTHLFVSHAAAGRLEGMLHRSLADRLAERLPDVDLHLVGRD